MAYEKSGFSLRMDERLKKAMAMHEDVNWSAVVRKAVQHKLEEIEHPVIDVQQAEAGLEAAANVRKKRAVTTKPIVEIIREWRERRK